MGSTYGLVPFAIVCCSVMLLPLSLILEQAHILISTETTTTSLADSKMVKCLNTWLTALESTSITSGLKTEVLM